MRGPEISFACPECGEEISTGLGEEVSCSHCHRATTLPLSPSIKAGEAVDRCPACEGRELYVQRDFNQKAGVLVVGIGAIFAPFTHYLSLVAAALVDAGLYMVLSEVTVCYRCAAHFRGFSKNPAHKPYDLHLAEQYGSRSVK